MKSKGGLQFAQGRWFVRLRNGSKAHYARCLMEAHFGRTLDSREHVHHINGDKTDDRVENLLVLSEAEHHVVHTARGDYGRRPYKLTDKQIQEIVTSPTGAVALAERFGVSVGLIYYHRRKALLKSHGRS